MSSVVMCMCVYIECPSFRTRAISGESENASAVVYSTG